jgi:pimeloyl-ACP methyl ester carboxylesterase
MWARQERLLSSRGFDVVAPDLPGFGTTPEPPSQFSFVDLVAQLLPATLVGNSFGGRIALETALSQPEGVDSLVLVDAGIRDHVWSDEITAYWEREEELLDAGDLDAATQLTLDVFALPHVHEFLRPMQRRAYELQTAGSEAEVRWPPPAPLSSLRSRTLVLVGEHDLGDFHAIAHRIAREAADARVEVVAGAKHLPSVEEPERFEAVLFRFLDG